MSSLFSGSFNFGSTNTGSTGNTGSLFNFGSNNKTTNNSGTSTTTFPSFNFSSLNTPSTNSSTSQASTTSASTTPASTTQASTTPSSTTSASTTLASTTSASTTPASTTSASTTQNSSKPLFDFTSLNKNPSNDSKQKNKTNPINFNLSGGLSFFDPNKKTDKKQSDKKTSLTGGFNMSFGGSGGSMISGGFYEDFLKIDESQIKNKPKEKSTQNPAKPSKTAENLFEVNYVPISGVHFDQIFIQKEKIYEPSDDQSIAPSFNQTRHISQTLDSFL